MPAGSARSVGSSFRRGGGDWLNEKSGRRRCSREPFQPDEFARICAGCHLRRRPVRNRHLRRPWKAPQESARSGDGKSPDDWRFAATVYGWAVNLNGSATARGNTVNINASIFDLLQKSNSLIGFMGDFEADKGRFGFFADVVWAQLAIPASRAAYANPIAGVKLSLQANAADTLSMTIIEAAGLFEVGKWPGSDQSFTALDAYAGGRFWNVSNQINLDLTGAIGFSDPRLSQFDRSKTIGVADTGSLYWADPMIGLRLRHQFTPSQHAFIKGDIGGFGLSGSSQFSWQVAARLQLHVAVQRLRARRRHRLPGAVDQRQLQQRRPITRTSISSFTAR